jgi:hypothetical protein
MNNGKHSELPNPDDALYQIWGKKKEHHIDCKLLNKHQSHDVQPTSLAFETKPVPHHSGI